LVLQIEWLSGDHLFKLLGTHAVLFQVAEVLVVPLELYALVH